MHARLFADLESREAVSAEVDAECTHSLVASGREQHAGFLRQCRGQHVTTVVIGVLSNQVDTSRRAGLHFGISSEGAAKDFSQWTPRSRAARRLSLPAACRP